MSTEVSPEVKASSSASRRDDGVENRKHKIRKMPHTPVARHV
jgi:hypothetical protein